ncbi:MAG: phosphotransferase [Planctomycetes bacterium]|nr:phosphotransferase [Planctomycetota bacterium]
MSPVDKVLSRYPAGLAATVQRIRHQSGFSGAQIWRTDGLLGSLCLRMWPANTLGRTLDNIHALLEAAASVNLEFVPKLIRTARGGSWLEIDEHIWELTTWRPGKSDFREKPTSARLKAACVALAQLHLAWDKMNPSHGPCPAVARRWTAWREWSALWESGWRPVFDEGDPVTPRASQAISRLERLTGSIPQLLEPWNATDLPVHACLCDIWHDHVLFTGDEVTGLIDYGSVKWDNAAVDLARLLGSLVGDPPGWSVGIEAYRTCRELSPEETELAKALDRSGVILGVANWIRWLYHQKRPYEDREAVAGRLAELVRRMDRW